MIFIFKSAADNWSHTAMSNVYLKLIVDPELSVLQILDSKIRKYKFTILQGPGSKLKFKLKQWLNKKVSQLAIYKHNTILCNMLQ